MNWRSWVFGKLTTTPVSTHVPTGSVFAGGALTGSPDARPFIVYRMADESSTLRGDGGDLGSSLMLTVWAYDNAGSYDRIDTILSAVRSALSGVVASAGAVACEWLGNSPELEDRELNALTRFATFKLIGATS